MNGLRRWVVLLIALCATLPLLAPRADAQRDRDRDRGFVGVYERVKPGRRGQVHYLLSIRQGGRAEETIARPNGSSLVVKGSWDAHDRHLNVTMNGGDRDVSGHLTYRLDGRNLVRVDEPHIFYKKQ